MKPKNNYDPKYASNLEEIIWFEREFLKILSPVQ
jgi:hypothetical protein